MKYTQKSFTFVGSPSDTYTHARAVCGEHGHMETDRKGKCLRCGERPTSRVGTDFSRDEDWGR